MSSTNLKLVVSCGAKVCTRCGEKKPIEDFYFKTKASGKRTARCRQCIDIKNRKWAQTNREKCVQYSRLWQQRNPESQRDWGYRNKYGITLTDYNSMFEAQAGQCRICQRHQSELKHGLRVDHCHKTGKVRGLLCHSCNVSLGHLREDIETIKQMLVYLEVSK